MAKRKWIAKAIKRPGALTAKATAAGMTVSQYCHVHGRKADTLTRQQCNLAKTLRKFARKRKKPPNPGHRPRRG